MIAHEADLPRGSEFPLLVLVSLIAAGVVGALVIAVIARLLAVLGARLLSPLGG